MAQAVHTFTTIELTELLVKKLDLHEGLWQLYTEWMFQAGVVGPGPTPTQMFPGGMIALLKVGLQKVDQANPISIDAAEVNPRERALKEGEG